VSVGITNTARLVATADLPYMLKMSGWYSEVSGLQLDGANRAAVGIVPTGHFFKISECHFENFSADSATIRGGGVLYGRICDNIWLASCKGYGIDLLQSYGSAGYYGLNVGWIERNCFFGVRAIRIEGSGLLIQSNDFEATLDGPMVQIGTGNFQTRANLRDNYFELKSASTGVVAIRYCASTRGEIAGNDIYGQQADGCIALDMQSPHCELADVHGNLFARWGTAVRMQLGGTRGVGWIGANYYANCDNRIAYTITNNARGIVHIPQIKLAVVGDPITQE
jgi:hypothetical protein